MLLRQPHKISVDCNNEVANQFITSSMKVTEAMSEREQLEHSKCFDASEAAGPNADTEELVDQESMLNVQELITQFEDNVSGSAQYRREISVEGKRNYREVLARFVLKSDEGKGKVSWNIIVCFYLKCSTTSIAMIGTHLRMYQGFC